MRSRARVAGHAIHPILIAFPLGLFSTAVLFDVFYLITDKSSFATAAAYTMGVGAISGPIAGAFGWIDWWKIPANTRAKRVGLIHGVGNVVINLLFLGSWLLRAGETAWQPTAFAMVLSFAGIAFLGYTGWLGGELVERLGISVEDDANVNAPSSLARGKDTATPTTRTAH
jgi:uncharacterized membrane protein